MAKKKKFWYVKPMDAHTNEVIAKHLQKDENAHFQRRDTDGALHDVWECDPDFLMRLFRSAKGMHLRFMIFTSEAGTTMKLWVAHHKW